MAPGLLPGKPEDSMSTTGERLRSNAWGRYYVTDECDGCGICVSYAACNFASSDDGSYCYLVQQPFDDAEELAVRDAFEACPKSCIKDDGEAA
jgi:ferredoxin